MKNSQDQNEDVSEQKVPPYLQIGLRMAKFRKSLGFSVPEMAREIQEEYKTYSNYEKGWRKASSGCREKLFKLGLNLNWLDTGDPRESMVLPLKPSQTGALDGLGAVQLGGDSITGSIRAQEEDDARSLTPAQAAREASQFTREVLTEAPHLREAWTDEERDEFLAHVTFLLTQPGGRDQAASLRRLLTRTARQESRKAKDRPASS